MEMRIGRPRGKMLLRLAAGAALSTLLGGCITASHEPYHTGAIGNSAIINSSDLSSDEAIAAVQKWGNAYSRNEKDKVAALNYSAALRGAGQPGQAVAVMRKAAIYNSEDREVLAGYGKALAANGDFEEALNTIHRAQRSDNPDWQLLSTEGGILDSVNRHEEARALYAQALVLAPGEPQILNNLGLSYMLTNDLDAAERTLREAVASPNASLKTRQNLALVLKLRGKQAEADQLVGSAAAADSSAADATVAQATEAPAAPTEVDTWTALAKGD